MKVVKNVCYGGYGLSELAIERLSEITGKTFEQCEEEYAIHCDNKKRADPALVQTVEELGYEANGKYANLVIVDIPDDVNWTIGEYDGVELIEEVHRYW